MADPRDTTEDLGETELSIFVDFDRSMIDIISTKVEGEGEDRHTTRFVLSVTPVGARRISEALERALVELVLHGMQRAQEQQRQEQDQATQKPSPVTPQTTKFKIH